MKLNISFLVFILFLFPYFLEGQTILEEGEIQGTLILAESPYYVQGNLLVPEGQFLKIEPGVEILFEGQYSINVKGSCQANGIEGAQILFSTTAQNQIGWEGFLYNQTSIDQDSSFYNHVIFEKAYKQEQQDASRAGGAFHIDQFSKIKFTNCIFKENYSGFSGGSFGLYNQANIIVERCSFRNHMGPIRAGVIEINNASPSFINCEFTNNSGFNGHVFRIVEPQSRPSIKGCSFTNNGHDMFAPVGTIYLFFGGTAVITGNTFDNNILGNENSQGGIGGAIANNSFNTTGSIISHNYFSNNLALGESAGGAILADGFECIDNNVFYNNKSFQGGAIFVFNGTSSKIINNTIYNNEAEDAGGGVFLFGSNTEFYNNIILKNEATLGNQIAMVSTVGGGANPTFYNNNLEGGSDDIFIANANSGIQVYENNIDINPDFENASNANFKLSSNSSCIDAGTIDIPNYDLPPFDINNKDRIMGSSIDMGAHEYSLLNVNVDNPYSKDIIEVFPNPAASFLNITMKEEALGSTFTLHNLAGEIIQQGTFINKKVCLDLRNISCGIYYLRTIEKTFKVIHI